MDSLSLILSPSDSLLLNQTINEIRTRLERQNIKLTMVNQIPLQNILRGTLTGRLLYQKFNSYWATPIKLETKHKELWLEIILEQSLTNDLLDIFENPSLIISEVVATLSKPPNEVHRAEEIINLSIENFNFKEGHNNLSLLCNKDGYIRINNQINFSLVNVTVQSCQPSLVIPPPTLSSSSSPTFPAFTVPPPKLPLQNNLPNQANTSTPFRGKQVSTNMTRPTRPPFGQYSPVGARQQRWASQARHISYVQKRINRRTGYHTYEDMETGHSESEIDIGMYAPVGKERVYKKKSDNEPTGIYSKLRSTLQKANPKEKKDEGLMLLGRIMSKMKIGMKQEDIHRLFLDEHIRGEDSSGSDLETNLSNLMESSKHAESTLVPVEPEKEKGDGSNKAQNSENSTPADLPTLGNPFLPSPEMGNESAEASPVVTRSKCQKNSEY